MGNMAEAFRVLRRKKHKHFTSLGQLVGFSIVLPYSNKCLDILKKKKQKKFWFQPSFPIFRPSFPGTILSRNISLIHLNVAPTILQSGAIKSFQRKRAQQDNIIKSWQVKPQTVENNLKNVMPLMFVSCINLRNVMSRHRSTQI